MRIISSMLVVILLTFSSLMADTVTYSISNIPTNPIVTNNSALIQIDYSAGSGFLPKFDSSLGTLTDVSLGTSTYAIGFGGLITSTLPVDSTDTWGVVSSYDGYVVAPSLPAHGDPYWTYVGDASSGYLYSSTGAGSVNTGFGGSWGGDWVSYSWGGLSPTFLNSYIANFPGETFNIAFPLIMSGYPVNATMSGMSTATPTTSVDYYVTYTYSLATPEPETYMLLGSMLLLAAGVFAVKRKRHIQS